MASPINFGDVVKAIELCKSIKEKCFTRINSADLHYREFKRDILELDKRLSQLENDVHNALQQVSGKDIACHDMLKQEAADMVGGLKTTLKDCQDFLEENIKLNSRKANVLENYSWHSSSRVKDLRARIQNHTYKIFLVIKSVELQLQADIAANTHVLLDNTNEMLSILRKDAGLSVPRQLPEIPTFVVNKFTIALNRNCTVTLDDPLLLPLSEGVDILSLHFRECSVQSTSSGIPPTLEQNLSLLKAHWLVLLIETSQAFSQSRPGSLSRRMVKQIELGVEEQYKYRQITFWKAQDFEGLADSPFDIWRPRPVLKPEPATAAVGREEILANVALESRYEGHAESLIILRVSDKTIRTVLSRSYKDESTSVQTIERTEKFFDLDTDGLVPLYAIAEASERRWNVNVDYGKGGSVAYELQSRDDAFAVQRALTGYQPYAFSEAVYCAVSLSRVSSTRFIRRDQFTGRGESQLWRWPPRVQSRRPRQVSTASGASRSGEFSIQSGSTFASQTFGKFTPSVFSITEAKDEGIGKNDDLVVAALPSPPLLVVFMKEGHNYTMWQVDVSELIDAQQAFIKRKKLWRLVLEHTSKSNFKVRKISAPDDLEHFNLCALISPDHASTSVAILEAKEIALDFTSESKRAEFLVDFKTVVGERLKEIKQFNAGRDIARNLAHRPRRTSTFDSQQSSPSNLTIRAPLRASTHTANGSSEPLSLTSTRRSIMVVQS